MKEAYLHSMEYIVHVTNLQDASDSPCQVYFSETLQIPKDDVTDAMLDAMLAKAYRKYRGRFSKTFEKMQATPVYMEYGPTRTFTTVVKP